MSTELHWIDTPWPGRVALSSRPRGGDWLVDEAADWKKLGINVVLSLLTPDEEDYLSLSDEPEVVRSQDMKFMSFPIPDRQVPASESEMNAILEKLTAELSSGKNAVVHCRQGVGRTGLVVACLLIMNGLDPKAAVQMISAARGVPVPETQEQRQWIDHYAAILASTK